MADMTTVQEPSWPIIGMTTAEAAKVLRVDEKTIRDAIRTGGLPARLVGRGFRIEEGALRSWLASGTGEGRRPPKAKAGKAEADGNIEDGDRLFPQVSDFEDGKTS